jgi:hypothetical protein
MVYLIIGLLYLIFAYEIYRHTAHYREEADYYDTIKLYLDNIKLKSNDYDADSVISVLKDEGFESNFNIKFTV